MGSLIRYYILFLVFLSFLCNADLEVPNGTASISQRVEASFYRDQPDSLMIVSPDYGLSSALITAGQTVQKVKLLSTTALSGVRVTSEQNFKLLKFNDSSAYISYKIPSGPRLLNDISDNVVNNYSYIDGTPKNIELELIATTSKALTPGIYSDTLVFTVYKV